MLDYNQIKMIHRLLFSSNKKLEFISLSNNFINQFNLDFKPLTKLRFLHLYNNMLTTLKQSVFKNVFINTSELIMDIENNTFKCECDMNWIRDVKVRYDFVYILDRDMCETKNISTSCWFNISQHECPPINKSRCYDNG